MTSLPLILFYYSGSWLGIKIAAIIIFLIIRLVIKFSRESKNKSASYSATNPQQQPAAQDFQQDFSQPYSKPNFNPPQPSAPGASAENAFYCRYCGKRFSSVNALQMDTCFRHPDTSTLRKHELYNGPGKPNIAF